MTKAALRKIYLRKQKSLSAAAREANSRRIADWFFQSFDLTAVQCLHVFLTIEKNGEVETRFIYRRLWKDFPRVAVAAPRVDFQTMRLDNRRFAPATKLIENRWRISEPADGERIQTERLDVCLVPLLCFDRNGFRAGYGKGFYDRFLIECRPDCLKIGLSFFAPVEEIADRENFDVKLDFCLTPEAIWKF